MTGIVESLILIFTAAALLAALALYTRQPLLVAYIAVGCLVGPNMLAWVPDAALLGEIAEIGIIVLLFLVGLDLEPDKLLRLFRKGLITALASSVLFFLIGFGVMRAFGFTPSESVVTGLALTFSSTIVGIKLLPTTVLHHRHIGEVVVALLLLQDLLAIAALIYLNGSARGPEDTLQSLGALVLALPALILAAFAGVRWLIMPVLRRFDTFPEFTFLLALGWCLGIAWLAHACGMSFEIGAFIAGVSLATSPIAQVIALNLQPLRDFFLVLFFVAVGADIDFGLLSSVLLPTLVLALLVVLLKPPIFALLLHAQGEDRATAWETGFRLGQASEFSLLVAFVATAQGLLGAAAAHVILAATVMTLILSTYAVIFRYPSPIAPNPKLRRD
ncbi:MAG: cation:proton antiporter [Gammaproteobacteria bacterium]